MYMHALPVLLLGVSTIIISTFRFIVDFQSKLTLDQK